MRHSSDLPTSRFYTRSFALITAAVLAFLLFRVLAPFIVPTLWGALLAFMFQPLYRKLVARWHRPSLASGLVTGLVAVTIILPMAAFLALFVRQASELVGQFQAQAHDRKLPALQLALEWEPVRALLGWLEGVSSLSRQQLFEKATDAAQEGLQLLASASGSLVLGAFGVLSTFGLTMFLLFFFVRDGREMLTRAIHLVPMSEARKDELRAHLGAVTRAVVMGTLVTSLVQGTLLGIGFAIAGLPSPVVFGAVGALASLVPVVGTALVWIPAVLTLFAQGSAGWAIFLTVWCAVLVVGSDNIIRPMIISGSTNVSTMLIIVGVMGGVGAFGFTGIIAGPVFLSLVAALLRYADESRLGTVPLPTPPPAPRRPAAEAPAP